jgi:hypothetical protein
VEHLLLPLPEQSEEDEELRQAPHCNQSIDGSKCFFFPIPSDPIPQKPNNIHCGIVIICKQLIRDILLRKRKEKKEAFWKELDPYHPS